MPFPVLQAVQVTVFLISGWMGPVVPLCVSARSCLRWVATAATSLLVVWPVEVTQALGQRGLGGTLSGFLTAFAGRSLPLEFGSLQFRTGRCYSAGS